MNLTQFAGNVPLMKLIAFKMLLKHVLIAPLLFYINVIRQIFWTQSVDNAVTGNKIVMLIKHKHAMNAIQRNQSYCLALTNVTKQIL